MDRNELMRLKGELVTAQEELCRVRNARQSQRQTLQSLVSGLDSRPLREQDVDAGCESLREYYRLQQEERYWRDEEVRFRQALAGAR